MADAGNISKVTILSGDTYTVKDPNAVSFSASQSLTSAQQTTARTNIGAGTYSKPSNGIPAEDLADGVVPTNLSEFTDDLGGNPVHTHKTNTIQPIATKTYSNVLATTDNVNTLRPFMRVIPTDWDIPAMVEYRFHAYVDGRKSTFSTRHECRFDFYHDALLAYSCKNYIGSTSYRTIYYNSLMTCTSSYRTIGHLVGINYYDAGNSYSGSCTTSGYGRTFEIELLQADNCTIEWLSACDTVSSSIVSGYVAGTTHTAIKNQNGATQGEVHSGDANTTSINNLIRGGGNYVANSALYRYQLLFTVDENKLTPLNNVNNNTGTTKTMLTNVEFEAFSPMYYYNSTTSVSSSGAIAGGACSYAWYGVDLRYTFNCGTTLTAHRFLYLVVTPTTGGKCKIASASPLTQTLPTTNDGKWYILLGRTYSTYQLAFYPHHPVYYHDGTSVRQLDMLDIMGDASTVNGHTVEKDVPSNAVFTDTTYESKSAASGGTDVSLVTTGEKYTWNNKGTYSKPSTGIPKTDLASAVQTSLGKADTALQSFTETDPVFTASDAYGITSTDIMNWNNKSDFSGSYTDLTNKPAALPSVTASDNGKILRVVSGAWAAVELPSASGVSF